MTVDQYTTALNTSPHDLENPNERALDAVSRALGTDKTAILLADERGDLRCIAWRGLSESYRHALEAYSPWPRDAADPRRAKRQ